ncbi:MAG: Mur ligase family protein [Symplocastrum torsivum CPER-KK1]|uniref:Lipid II isoglutaminyl synthase (glutamine-hydrolyzing) subunit MurT n=1 Tax=Symplocastrum torsivum CPER-KK1 TaxID=450513 RepID=A0A951PKU4_9CYAN|nr:Mur ligase family protein [Symplocastrum torsivum CPER-KK1]
MSISIIDRLRLGVSVGAAKTVTSLVRLLRLGAASVLPGDMARRLQPKVLPLLFGQVRRGVILIVGTNGKTTTSLLLRTILERQGWRVAHNATGANLINGLVTALLDNTSLIGQLDADYAILEVDENVLPLVLRSCQPQFILGLNLFRDQLDRYGEVDTISQRWQKAIAPLPTDTVVILNADDPTLSRLGQQLPQKVLFFGLSEPEAYLDEIPHAVDSIYCPSCGHPLDYKGVYLSHLGDYHCPSCGFSKSQLAVDSREWPQILIGIYNKYNTLAAGLVAKEIGIDIPTIYDTVKNFRAAFGRAEELDVKGKHVRILLSKNPVGMNETIRAVNDLQKNGGASTKLLVLNDRTPDGTDVSWIWDVDTEKLVASGGTVVVSGDRVYDMALRLRYSETDGQNNFKLIVKEDLKEAIATALEHTPANETLHILPTYSAMLEVRGLLTGRQIL